MKKPGQVRGEQERGIELKKIRNKPEKKKAEGKKGKKGK